MQSLFASVAVLHSGCLLTTLEKVIFSGSGALRLLSLWGVIRHFLLPLSRYHAGLSYRSPPIHTSTTTNRTNQTVCVYSTSETPKQALWRLQY
jgi:hypothetical protein